MRLLFQVELETEQDVPTQYVVCNSYGEAETTINKKIVENKWQATIHSIQLLTRECEIMP